MITANAAWNIWNFRRSLIQSLIEDGHQVTVLAPADESVTQLERLGCRFLPLQMNAKTLNLFDIVKLRRQFDRTFKAERPDVVLSYTIKNNIFGALVARSCEVPFIPNVTGLGTAFLSGGPLRALAKTLYRYAFRSLPVILFQNRDDLELFVASKLMRPEQARLLPGSGIDLTHFAAADLPSPSQSPTFLMIARLIRDKGVVEFVDAARQVKAKVPGARFQLLGAVAAENRTAISAATVKSWQQEGVVEYLGTTADVRPFIAAAHCVVLPSYREGAPRTLIEAAAMARPLIATDVPGCRSVADHETSGFLCQVRSSDSLAAAIFRFLDLSHSAKVEMGQASRAKMEREFDEAFVIAAYRQAISELAQ